MTGIRSIDEIGVDELHGRSTTLLDAGHRLATVVAHDDGDFLRVVYVFTMGPPDVRHELVVRLNATSPVVPSLSDLSFVASRFERELHDTFGICLLYTSRCV